MISKKKLQKIIYQYHLNTILVLSGKNRLSLIPTDVQNIIMSKINPKNIKLDIFEKETNNHNYEESIIIKECQKLMKDVQKSQDEKKLLTINLLDYLISNSKFCNDYSNTAFCTTFMKKMHEFAKECKNNIDNNNKNLNKQDFDKLNQQYKNLYFKINEATQKIFGIKLPNYCNHFKCNNSQSTLKNNYGLCHIHLSKKFINH
mgnify:CR=1 FL=1